MPVEQACSPPGGGSGGEEHRAEEPPQAVYLLPLYTVAIVDPNELGESGLPLNFGGEATGLDVTVEQKRRKLVTRKKGAILEYDDDDDPHKPTPKRLRNRMKSQKSRDKKKAYMSGLQSRVKELEKMISELERQCHILQNENEALKNEALETDPDAEEKLILYYEKLQKEKEETEKSVGNQEDAPAKSACSQVSFREKCTEITGREDDPNIDIDEVTGQEGNAHVFAEADDPACTSEMNAHECDPLKFDSAKFVEITGDNILNVDECEAQNAVQKTSSSCLQLNN